MPTVPGTFGFLGRNGGSDRSGGRQVFRAPVDVVSTGEKTPIATPFKKGDIIHAVRLCVFTAETTSGTKTIDVGFDAAAGADNDPDGLVDGLSTAAAGTIAPTVAVTTGANTKFFASTTFGVLLSDFQAGTDVDQDEGLFREKPFVVTQDDSVLTYTLGDTHVELVAAIEVEFTRPEVRYP